MSNALTHDVGAFALGTDAPAGSDDSRKKSDPAQPQTEEPPVGYRWVSRRWRVLPDGTRDYAAYHGKTAFSFLLPVSSKVRTPNR